MAKQLNVNLAFNADTSKAKAQIQDLQNQLDRLIINPTNNGQFKMTTDLRQASTAAAELKAHLNQAMNTKTGNLDFAKLNQSIKKSGMSLQEYSQKLLAIGPNGQQAFTALAQSVAKSEVSLRRSNTLLTNMATTLKNTARWQLSSSLLHGFMGSIQSAYNYAKDLDKSLTNIRIVTGQSSEQMSKFAVEANKAAKALSTTTTKYTDAALIYYQQGLDDKAVKERTDVSIKMANVTGDAVQEVSSYMTAIWNNFNKEGKYAEEHFADIMTKLGAETAASTDEIAAGLSKFSAVADTIQLSFEMASSAVTAIVDQTRESPEVVGTALKTIFSRIEGLKMGETLEDGTDLNKYSEGLAKVGVDIKDASGNLRDMDSILHDIGDTWEKLSNDEQVALAQTVAGVRQYNQFMALFDNWDHVEENLEMAAEAGGTLQEQADIYAESWQGASNRLRATLEDLWMKLLDDKAFIKAINVIADIVDHISNLVDTVGGLQGVFALLGATLTKVFSAQISQGISNMAYNLASLVPNAHKREQEARAAFLTNASQSFYSDSGQSASQKAQQTVMSQTIGLQTDMIAKAEKMSEIEKQTVQYMLEGVEAQGQQLILAQQNVEASAQNLSNVKDRAMAEIGANAQMDHPNKVGERVLTGTRMYDAGSAQLGAISKFEQEIPDILAKHESVENAVREIQAKWREVNTEVSKYNGAIKKSGGSDLTNVKHTMDNIDTSGSKEDVKNQILGRVGAAKQQTQSNIMSNVGIEDPKIVEDLADAHDRTAKAAKDAAKQEKLFNQQVDATAKKIKTAKGHHKGWAEGLTTVANAASTAFMALSMLNGISATLKNPDLSGWDKFVSVGTSIAMALPLIMSSVSSLTSLGMAMNAASLTAGQYAGAVRLLTTTLGANQAMEIASIATSQGMTTAKLAEILTTQHGIEAKTAETLAEQLLTGSKQKGVLAAISSVMYKKAESLQSVVKAGTTTLETGATELNTAATWANVAAKIALWIASNPLVAVIAGVGLAAIGAAVAINTLSKREKSAAKQAKEAKETEDELRQSYEDSKTKLGEVTDAIDELHEKRKALKDLEEGTEDWNKALEDSNDYILGLIDKYPELAKYLYTNKDGSLGISESGLEQWKEQQEQEVNRKSAAVTMASGQSDSLQAQANEDEMKGKMHYVSNEGWTSKKDGVTYGRETVQIDDTSWNNVVDLVTKHGMNVTKADLLEAVGGDEEMYKIVQSYLPEIVDMIAENNGLLLASQIQGEVAVKKIAMNMDVGAATQDDFDNTPGLAGALADNAQDEYDKEYSRLEGLSKEDIVAEYLALDGNEDLEVENMNGSNKNKDVEFEDGSEMSVDAMMKEIAAANGMMAAAEKWEQVALMLNGINGTELGKQIAGNLGEAVLSGGKDDEFDIEGTMTRDDIIELASRDDVTAKDLGITEQAALDAGYTADKGGMEAYANDFMNQVRGQADIYNQSRDNALDDGLSQTEYEDNGFLAWSDADITNAQKIFTEKGKEVTLADLGITNESNLSDDEYIKQIKTGVQEEYDKIQDGTRYSMEDEYFSQKDAWGDLYKGKDGVEEMELRDSRTSKNERDKILGEAGVSQQEFDNQKNELMQSDAVIEDVGGQKNMDEMTKAYEKYLDAKEKGLILIKH